MKGLIVNISGETLRMALDDGSLTVLLSNKYIDEEFVLDCMGMDSDGNVYNWCNEQINDRIVTIELADILDTEVAHARLRTIPDEKEENQLMLECYNRLKTDLTREGLI